MTLRIDAQRGNLYRQVDSNRPSRLAACSSQTNDASGRRLDVTHRQATHERADHQRLQRLGAQQLRRPQEQLRGGLAFAKTDWDSRCGRPGSGAGP